MSVLVAPNTISIEFLVALITHSMDLFLALECEFKLLTLLSVHEHTHQIKTDCERTQLMSQNL